MVYGENHTIQIELNEFRVSQSNHNEFLWYRRFSFEERGQAIKPFCAIN